MEVGIAVASACRLCHTLKPSSAAKHNACAALSVRVCVFTCERANERKPALACSWAPQLQPQRRPSGKDTRRRFIGLLGRVRAHSQLLPPPPLVN